MCSASRNVSDQRQTTSEVYCRVRPTDSSVAGWASVWISCTVPLAPDLLCPLYPLKCNKGFSHPPLWAYLCMAHRHYQVLDAVRGPTCTCTCQQCKVVLLKL